MTEKSCKHKAPRNRTLQVSEAEIAQLREKLIRLSAPVQKAEIENTTIQQNAMEALDYFPQHCVDLVFADPPYNLTKTFHSTRFKAIDSDAYEAWLDSWVKKVVRVLKPQASFYLCGDWRSSSAIFRVMEKYFTLQNRITFEREKGRGAKQNWKNASEDIWFCTLSDAYHFDVDAVKLKRKVLAPYKANGQPKDWAAEAQGNYRITHPSNLWTDITIPFWSMPENTEHPTQKPEKLLAKILLASTKENDLVLDPFLGSGTTSVVAKKLGRKYIGIEIEEIYCCWAEKRLALAEKEKTIQGYVDGVFWERNAKVHGG